MTRFLLSGAALAALVAITPATAQPTQPTQAPLAQRAPAVQAHSRAQVGVQVASLFQRLDTNLDGFITRAESDAAKGARGERRGAQRQGRGDRSPDQRAEFRATMFDRIDANRDGMISRDEFARSPGGRDQRVAGRGERGERGPRAMGGKRGGGMGMAGLRGRMFDMADVNRDARVSLQEATAAAYRAFDMADANRDGQVTRDERMQVRQRMRGAKDNG
jgi:Ca2+-binding EF-hand superfamily protein